jgi:hypothetical protein
MLYPHIFIFLWRCTAGPHTLKMSFFLPDGPTAIHTALKTSAKKNYISYPIKNSTKF